MKMIGQDIENHAERRYNICMYLGQYDARIGEKNRVAFPKKFRELAGSTLIITNWFENALAIFAKNFWETLAREHLQVDSFLVPDARELTRFIFAGASELMLDDQGRFILPEHLKQYGRIEKDAVFIGVGNYIELWDEALWGNYRGFTRVQIKELARRVAEYPKKIEETEGNPQ